MRKTVTFLLTMTLVLSFFAGCGNVATDTTPTESQNSTQASQPTESTQPTAPAATEETLADRLTRQIEADLAADAQLPEYQSNAGQCDLWDKYTKVWERVAIEYYNEIMVYEGEGSVMELQNAVIKIYSNWDSFSQTQYEEYVKALQYTYQGGSIVGPMAANYRYELKKQWALEIVYIYQQLP